MSSQSLGTQPAGVRAVNRPETRQAWRGPSLLVLDNQWRAGGDQPLTGYFFRETRYLSRFQILIDGEEPVCASAAEVAPSELEFTYIYPPVETRGGGGSGSGGDHERFGIPSRGLDLVLRLSVRPASVEATLALTSRWKERLEVGVTCEIAADFAGLFEAMGGERRQRAAVECESTMDGLLFRYRRLERLEEHLDDLPQLFAPAETPLVSLTSTALRDLGSVALLEGERDEWLMPAAGYPLYPAVFGRDAATASWQAAAFDRGELARATAARLARLQGTRRDDARDELPGRIIQQARRDPLSRLGQVPSTATTVMSPARSCTSSRSGTRTPGPAVVRCWNGTGTRCAAF